MRGRKPIPTALKILRGNPGKRKLTLDEPKPAAGVPALPDYLDKTAGKEWRRVVGELERLRLLTVLDGAALEGYCASYSKAVRAEKLVKKHGLVVRTPNGFTVTNPAISIARREWDQCRKFMVEFGLTPASRPRIKPGEAPPAADATAAFLFGRKHA